MPTTRTAAAIERDLAAARRAYDDLAAQCGQRTSEERAALKAIREKHDALKADKLAAWQRMRALEAELAASGAPDEPTTAAPAGATATAPAAAPIDDAEPADDDQDDAPEGALAEAAQAPARPTKKKRSRKKAGG